MNYKEDFYEANDLRIFTGDEIVAGYIIHNQGILLNKLNDILALIKENLK